MEWEATVSAGRLHACMPNSCFLQLAIEEPVHPSPIATSPLPYPDVCRFPEASAQCRSEGTPMQPNLKKSTSFSPLLLSRSCESVSPAAHP